MSFSKRNTQYTFKKKLCSLKYQVAFWEKVERVSFVSSGKDAKFDTLSFKDKN